MNSTSPGAVSNEEAAHPMTPQPDHEVVVIGAGFSGIGSAIALDRAGITDFVILESGDGVGGAWYWNTYPGVGVDIPSFSYQFSFHQRTDWSRSYAPGEELKAYAEDCVDSFQLWSRIQLNTTVTGMAFDETAHLWRLSTADGATRLARYVIGATGILTKPKPPDIPGLENYTGTVLHTARWDHQVDLNEKRVAVIGTGASAVQLIPAIAGRVGQLTVFQRTPIWCLPKADFPLPEPLRAALRHVPGANTVARAASHAFVELYFPFAAHYASLVPLARLSERGLHAFLRQQVTDPIVRDKLTPRYRLGCKRPSFSNHYLSTFNRDNVHLETTSIAGFTENGITTVDGTVHDVDLVILATGFKVFESDNMPPFPITGAGGTDLETWWQHNRYQAYEGASVPGFPNFFLILGPYGYNGSSYFTLIEDQARHIVRALTRAHNNAATRIEITREANDRYFADMLSRRHRQVFFQGSCAGSNSYYFDRHGDVPFRPALTLEATLRSALYNLNDYTFN